MTAPQSVVFSPKNFCRPIGTVYLLDCWRNVSAKMNSFQAVMKENTLVATTPGATSGTRILQNMRPHEAPSR